MGKSGVRRAGVGHLHNQGRGGVAAWLAGLVVSADDRDRRRDGCVALAEVIIRVAVLLEFLQVVEAVAVGVGIRVDAGLAGEVVFLPPSGELAVGG